MSAGPGFWPTVGRLLKAARMRSRSRGRHQQKLMNQRRGKNPSETDWGCLGTVFFTCVFFALNGMFAVLFHMFIDAARSVEGEVDGKFSVAHHDYTRLQSAARLTQSMNELRQNYDQMKARHTARPETVTAIYEKLVRLEFDTHQSLDQAITSAAQDRTEGSYDENKKLLRQQFETKGMAGFVDAGSKGPIAQSFAASPLMRLAGLVICAWWFIMLAFQGEGLELDFQRRRHPMWEWLLAHPVRPGAVFLAEMLSPLAANFLFLGAPAFWIGVHITIYAGFLTPLLTGLLAGVPVALAACCASKALEIAVLLRLSPRTRGAVLGLMSWLGYSAMMAGILAMNAGKLMPAAAAWLRPAARILSSPVLGWPLGLGMGEPSAWKGVLVCWLLGVAVILVAVWFSAWATNKGLAGGFGSSVTGPAALSAGGSRRWLRDPLHRKELLWFWRDRGALVQVFLLPLTIAAQQVFNLRNLAAAASYSWHTMAAAAVMLGTYFLFILGPRSLISEGQALWLPLTWPRGLESLLKAKARLWWFIACAVVSTALVVDVCLFPADAWRVGLVAAGWFLFSGSLAEKSVTLVTVPSSSGEPEPVPAGRRWAASLGTFTFATGVLIQNWSLAFVGIVYSWLTSAAMWQNFRARLPFLFDPWSEKLPPPPTLMHAMIAISAMTEGMAVMFGALAAFTGPGNTALAHSIAYGLAGLVTALWGNSWMQARGVPASAIWGWPQAERPKAMATFIPSWLRFTGGMEQGLVLGGALGAAALGYLWLLRHLPVLREVMLEIEKQSYPLGDHRIWLFITTVGFAPLAEEYLFRGLLYRALDREWGGWRAIVASSFFFAIYHPPISWLPVAALGCLNAWLFRRTGHLRSCVVAHMAYNAVVVGFS